MTMTVGSLIEALDGLPVDTLVILSSDEGGNSLKSLAECGTYVVEHDGYGYEYFISDPEDYPIEFNAIVLWP